MRQKAEYRSSLRSKRLIREAFLALMQEKELEKITVTDIITRADINRGTFYAHYQDTRAVIEQIENEIIAKMLEFLGQFHYENFFQDPLPLLTEISRYLEENQSYYRILINSKGAGRFIEKLKGIFVEHMRNDSELPASIKRSPNFMVAVNFFAGGVVNVFQLWFRGETKYSLSQITLALGRLIKSTSGSLLAA